MRLLGTDEWHLRHLWLCEIHRRLGLLLDWDVSKAFWGPPAHVNRKFVHEAREYTTFLPLWTSGIQKALRLAMQVTLLLGVCVVEINADSAQCIQRSMKASLCPFGETFCRLITLTWSAAALKPCGLLNRLLFEALLHPPSLLHSRGHSRNVALAVWSFSGCFSWRFLPWLFLQPF